MNKIRLEKIHSAGTSTHVKVLINDKDVGILYLNESELAMFIKSLRQGIYSADAELELNLFDDEENFDDDIDNEND